MLEKSMRMPIFSSILGGRVGRGHALYPNKTERGRSEPDVWRNWGARADWSAPLDILRPSWYSCDEKWLLCCPEEREREIANWRGKECWAARHRAPWSFSLAFVSTRNSVILRCMHIWEFLQRRQMDKFMSFLSCTWTITSSFATTSAPQRPYLIGTERLWIFARPFFQIRLSSRQVDYHEIRAWWILNFII